MTVRDLNLRPKREREREFVLRNRNELHSILGPCGDIDFELMLQ